MTRLGLVLVLFVEVLGLGNIFGKVNIGFAIVETETLRWITILLVFPDLESSGEVDEFLARSSVVGDNNGSAFLIVLLLVAGLMGKGKAIADNETSRKCFNEIWFRLESLSPLYIVSFSYD